MRIVLSGIETNNKGAELMLYAILKEIENVHPQATVYVPNFAVKQGLSYVKTSIDLRYKPRRWMSIWHICGLFRRLRLPYLALTDAAAVPNIDYFIDASGFAFSDQWNLDDERVAFWKYQLEGYKKQGTKIVFLPQAFGPVQKENTKNLLAILNANADVIMPREKVSYSYLKEANVDEDKIRLCTDFTSLVKGFCPEKYLHLKNGICIIPNMRMIDKGIICMEDYLEVLSHIINISKSKGFCVYLLNHEGKDDELLAYKCQELLSHNIEVVTGLNALEVKGLISTAYLCVTSRFHGVASALNSSVPCLATSWSHKYKELFNDYRLNDCVLDLGDKNGILNKIDDFLDKTNNANIRKHLNQQVALIQKDTKEMWQFVWNNV